jgi:hypothetical protein
LELEVKHTRPQPGIWHDCPRIRATNEKRSLAGDISAQ